MKRNSVWNADIIADVKSDHKDGVAPKVSAARISAKHKVRVTPPMVSGLIRRLGMDKTAPSFRHVNTMVAQAVVKKLTSPHSTPPKEITITGAIHDRPPVDIMALTLDTCRWPIGDVGRPGFWFCGCRTAPNSPYCQGHTAVAFQPRAEKVRGGRMQLERLGRMAYG